MRERHFWLDLAFVSLALSLVQFPFTPSRFGGIFFFVLAVGCVGEWVMLGHCDHSKACAILSVVGRILFGLFVLSFAFIQLFIIQRGMVADARAKTADYVLVLGALVNPSGRPSDTLAARCDTAVSVLHTNPEAKAVLCGGQGWNEPCTEASSMAAYMREQGISPDRLLLEEESSNTIQNIRNAVELVERDVWSKQSNARNAGTEKPDQEDSEWRYSEREDITQEDSEWEDINWEDSEGDTIDRNDTDDQQPNADGSAIQITNIPQEEVTIAVITSDYHLARARVLMVHAADLPPLGIPAPTPHPWQWLSMRCREYCSILGLMLSQRWHL